jgi:RNA polymerase sigma-70 factor (ECF subfamily)
MASLDELLAHAGWLRALAAALIADPTEADDLVQDTWLAAARHPPRSDRAARPWLTRVITNLAHNRRREAARRMDRERQSARSEALPSADDVEREIAMQRVLVEALGELDEPERSTIVRHFFHDASYARIAKDEGVPESTVRNRAKRALDTLRSKLDRKYGERRAWAALLVPLARRAALSSGTPVASGAAAIVGGILMSGVGKLLIGLAIVGVLMWGLKRSLDAPPPSTALATNEKERAAPPVAPLSEQSKPSGTPDERAPVAAAAPAPTPAPAAPAKIEDAAAVLEVRIVDPDGAPIAGAEVAIIDRGTDDATRAKSPHATSGADGRVRLDVHRSDRMPNRGTSSALGRDEWTLETEFTAPGRELRTDHPRFKAGTTTVVGDVALRTGGTLHGRVRVPADAPLAKMWVDVYAPDITVEERRRGAFTGLYNKTRLAWSKLASDGTYTVRGIPVGRYRVMIYPGGEGWLFTFSDVVEVRAGETAYVADLELARNPFVISGVVRTPDGSAPRHFEVASRTARSISSVHEQWLSYEVDKQGRFTIDFPSDAVVDLLFSDSQDKWGELIVHDVATGRTDLDVQLPEAQWIDLLVQDERHAPIVNYGTAVRFEGDEEGYSRSMRSGAHLDGKSQVLVRAEPFFLDISTPGRPVKAVGPFDPEHHPASLVVTLDDTLRNLRVRVLADGVPVAKARVELRPFVEEDRHLACNGFPSRSAYAIHSWRDDTDDEGHWKTNWTYTGPVMATVTAKGFATATCGPFELGVKAPHDEVVVSLTRGGSLEGRVIAGEGRSVEGVLVGISCGEGKVRIVRSAADGSFRFDTLAAGHWFVRRCEQDFEANGAMDCHEAGGFDPSLTPFDVVDARTTHCDLDLRETACTFDGKLESTGSAGQRWNAELLPFGAQPRNAIAAAVDDRGRFHGELTVLGAHHLALTGFGDRDVDQRIEDTIDVHRGANEWSLSFATGSIDGDATPGALLAHTWTSARGAKCTTHFVADAHGHFHVDGVPIGPGRVEVVQPKSKAEPTSVDVAAGEVTHVSVH